MDNIIWAQSNNLFFTLPIFLFGTILLSKQLFWVKKVINLLAGQKNLKNLLIDFSINKKIIKLLLSFLGLLSLSFALLRPQWKEEKQLITQEARDLVIAIDISKSMLAQDLKPNRLNFAKNKIKALIEKLNSERIGLIVFSNQAFCQCPLTRDINSIFTFLDAIDTETISSGPTSLKTPILKTIELFNNLDENRKNKLLVIFTDGEDFSKDLNFVKNKAKEIDLKIFTVAIGTTKGAPIPIIDDHGKLIDYHKDKKNNQIVISRLNEDILRNLSQETGAFYIKTTEDNTDIEKLTQKINNFEKEKIENKEINLHQEKYHYLTLLSFICLGLEWLI